MKYVNGGDSFLSVNFVLIFFLRHFNLKKIWWTEDFEKFSLQDICVGKIMWAEHPKVTDVHGCKAPEEHQAQLFNS